MEPNEIPIDLHNSSTVIIPIIDGFIEIHNWLMKLHNCIMVIDKLIMDFTSMFGPAA